MAVRNASALDPGDIAEIIARSTEMASGSSRFSATKP